MKQILKIGFFIGVALVIMAFATPEKKMLKIVNKVWSKEAILKDMNVDGLTELSAGNLKEVVLNGEIQGYVCYATAFGCRVGGCAAPKMANAGSYETFDYIVAYDKDLKIKKVDIADYGGSYGYEICNVRWLKQFVGSTCGFKLNENVDGITGATVSATYLIDDLNALGQELKLLLNEEGC